MILSSTMPCDRRPDACILQKQTIFVSSLASNLLSFVAIQLHCLHRAVGVGTSAPPAFTCRRVGIYGISNRDTHLYPPHNSSDDNRWAVLWADHQWNAQGWKYNTRLRTFIPEIGTRTLPEWPWHEQPSPASPPPPYWCRMFLLLLHKWDMVLSAACECGAEKTVDHVDLHCPIHRTLYGVHSLTVLDGEKMECLLSTCSEI